MLRCGQLINTALPVPLTRLRIKDLAENTPNLLPERSVKEATGVTSEIYRSIEAALGVRLVNLVYRHLATIPGALEWAWAVVGDGFSEGIYQQRSAPLVRLERRSADPQSIRPISLVDCSLRLSEASAVLDTWMPITTRSDEYPQLTRYRFVAFGWMVSARAQGNIPSRSDGRFAADG